MRNLWLFKIAVTLKWSVVLCFNAVSIYLSVTIIPSFSSVSLSLSPFNHGPPNSTVNEVGMGKIAAAFISCYPPSNQVCEATLLLIEKSFPPPHLPIRPKRALCQYNASEICFLSFFPRKWKMKICSINNVLTIIIFDVPFSYNNAPKDLKVINY